jgi:hypothetical protein
MLASTRFNHKTLAERNAYMLTKNILCYGTQNKVKSSVPLNTLLFVVEMNNEENQIVGIGLVRNMISPDSHIIYTDSNYHRYTYTGKYRITREQMEEFDKEMVDIFDLILFKGYTHIKRHSGITIIPPKLLNDDRARGMDLTEKVKEMFLNTFKI